VKEICIVIFFYVRDKLISFGLSYYLQLIVICFYFCVTERELQLQALKRYEAVCSKGEERLVSGSDDFTLFLWQPERDKKPICKSKVLISVGNINICNIQGIQSRTHTVYLSTIQTFVTISLWFHQLEPWCFVPFQQMWHF
jgi:hypothetical protein